MLDTQMLHDVGIVGVPVLLILAGLFFNNKGLGDLRAELNERFNRVDQRFDQMDQRFDRMDERLDRTDADLRQFYHLSGKLEGRVDSIEKRL